MSLDWRLITPETLISLKLEARLADIAPQECHAYGSELNRIAQDEGCWDNAQRECLQFAGTVLKMILQADLPSAPYGPLPVFGSPSACPDDFPKAELLGLYDWAVSLSNPELRARFLDVLWVRGKSLPAAQGAVEAYLEFASRRDHPENWIEVVERLERALRLAESLEKYDVTLKHRVLSVFVDMLKRHARTDPHYLSFHLIKLLMEFKHGDYREYASFAKRAAMLTVMPANAYRAHEYYALAAECYLLAGYIDAASTAFQSASECLASPSLGSAKPTIH